MSRDYSDRITSLEKQQAANTELVKSAHKRADEHATELKSMRDRLHDHSALLQNLVNDQKHDKEWKEDMKKTMEKLNNSIDHLANAVAENRRNAELEKAHKTAKNSVYEDIKKFRMWLVPIGVTIMLALINYFTR